MERLIADNGHLAQQCYRAAPSAYYAMLRVGEIVRLRLCDVILEGGDPHVIVTNSKRGKSCIVYLRSPLILPHIRVFLREVWHLRLTELRAAYPELSETELRLLPLFGSTTDETLNPLVVSHLFSKALMLVAPGCTTHSLGKSGATWRYVLGADVRDIAHALGHASPDVTFLAYLRTVNLDQRRAALGMTSVMHPDRDPPRRPPRCHTTHGPDRSERPDARRADGVRCRTASHYGKPLTTISAVAH